MPVTWIRSDIEEGARAPLLPYASSPPPTPFVSEDGRHAPVTNSGRQRQEDPKLIAGPKALLLGAAGLLCGFLLISLIPYITPPDQPLGNHRKEQPYCRKSASIAVLPVSSQSATYASGGGDGGDENSTKLVVWSGIGLHKAIKDDLFTFDLKGNSGWQAHQPESSPRPVSRWKAGNAQATERGMVITGGDAYTPHTFHHRYKHDVWLLKYPEMEWQEAYVNTSAPLPKKRRGHSTMMYKGEDGIDRVITWGGRTKGQKVLLNDAWEVALMWPNASWTQLTPQQLDSKDVPRPRRGHSTVLIDDAQSPQMLMYGGREEVDYFPDMWILDIKSKTWREVNQSGPLPPHRDHHSAAYYKGRLFIWAGHSGSSYSDAKPVNDLWAFDLGSGTWQQIPQHPPVPLPRFEQAYAQYTPAGGSQGSKLVIFGGQTAQVCQLNDVWELDLDTLQWLMLSAPHFCTRKCRKSFGGVRPNPEFISTFLFGGYY